MRLCVLVARITIENGSVESVCIICRKSPQQCRRNAMSNLVLIRTLRDSTDSDVRKLLRKMFTLECVRNKDRMAVEPIVRLTGPEVIEVLSKVSLVVHTLVPEKYTFWTSNQQGVCCHPVAICPGPLGSQFGP